MGAFWPIIKWRQGMLMKRRPLNVDPYNFIRAANIFKNLMFSRGFMKNSSVILCSFTLLIAMVFLASTEYYGSFDKQHTILLIDAELETEEKEDNKQTYSEQISSSLGSSNLQVFSLLKHSTILFDGTVSAFYSRLKIPPEIDRK